LLDLLLNRAGAGQIAKLVKQAAAGEIRILISIINWGEVYYVVWRNQGLAAAERVLQQIAALPIQVINTDSELTKLAASFRVRYHLPYADGFAAALAQEQNATLVTGDRDFAPLEKSIRILWLAAR
ncbi:MAG: type II toxin-antitoxin system VapC family toxin, partial [Terriglobia bacterium]